MSPFSLDNTQYLMCRGDYMTRPQEDNKAGPSKKQYAMTHDAGGVTVSEKVCLGPRTRDWADNAGWSYAGYHSLILTSRKPRCWRHKTKATCSVPGSCP